MVIDSELDREAAKLSVRKPLIQIVYFWAPVRKCFATLIGLILYQIWSDVTEHGPNVRQARVR